MIKRLKRKEYGIRLQEAALIGYVQGKNTLDFWHKRISDWIDLEIFNSKRELDWLISDHLSFIEKNEIVEKYYSICHRKDQAEIKLYHFLIDLKY